MRWPPPDGVVSRYPARSRFHRSPSPEASQISPNSRATPSATARPSNSSISRWLETSPRTRPTPGCSSANQVCSCSGVARTVWASFQFPAGRLVPSVATRTTLAPAVCQASAVVSVSCGGVVLKVRAPRWGGARPSVCVDVDGRACGRGGCCGLVRLPPRRGARGGRRRGGLEGGLVARRRGGGRGGGGVLRGRGGGRGGGGCRGGGLGERRLVRGHPRASAHVIGALNERQQGP